MDPLSISTAVFTSLRLSWNIGVSLKEFISSTKVVNETVNDLVDELATFGSVLDMVKTQIDLLAEQYEHVPVSSLQQRQDASIAANIKSQLSGGNRAMSKLDTALKGVRRDRGNFITQALRQFTLIMSKDDLSEIRNQIRTHTGNLQASLQLLTFKAVYLAPQVANQDLPKRLAELNTLIRQGGVDPALRATTRELITDGEMLYANSIAGSVAGHTIVDTDLGHQNNHGLTQDWLAQLQRLELGAPLSSIGRAHPSASITSTGSPNRIVNYTPATSVDGDFEHPTERRPADQNLFTEDEAELDDQDELEVDMTDSALDLADAYLASHDYAAAKSQYRLVLTRISRLSIQTRRKYKLFDLRYNLAVCSFHSEDSSNSEAALVSVVEKPSASGAEAPKIFHAGHLLAQLYLTAGKLDTAKMTCENSLRGRRRFFGKIHPSCSESLGLLSAIYASLGNPGMEQTCVNLIPVDNRESCLVWNHLRQDEVHWPLNTVPQRRLLGLSLERQPRQTINIGNSKDKALAVSPVGEMLSVGERMPFRDLKALASKLASERVARLHSDGVMAYREHRKYDNEGNSNRQRHDLVPLATFTHDDLGSSNDEATDARVENQQLRFESRKAIDQEKRANARKMVLAAAQKSVQAQLSAMDEKIFADTGKASPAMRAQWLAQAQAQAQAKASK